nr:hypothetical protein [Psychrobacter sp. PraFG1]UNK06228.1 hypothetical protein MN210_06515 [Psychrobacter sp. PraFG1]
MSDEDNELSEATKQALNKAGSANWYAKLHPTGKETPPVIQDKNQKILNLSLFFRIWIAVGVIVIISGIVVFNQLFNYVRPITQQVIEDTLVDTSKLLAASLQSAVESGEIYDRHYQSMLDNAFLAPTLPTKEQATQPHLVQTIQPSIQRAQLLHLLVLGITKRHTAAFGCTSPITKALLSTTPYPRMAMT